MIQILPLPLGNLFWTWPRLIMRTGSIPCDVTLADERFEAAHRCQPFLQGSMIAFHWSVELLSFPSSFSLHWRGSSWQAEEAFHKADFACEAGLLVVNMAVLNRFDRLGSVKSGFGRRQRLRAAHWVNQFLQGRVVAFNPVVLPLSV